VNEVDWERTVFTLIAPDGIARQLGSTILSRMESAGFAPMAWQVLWHRPPALDSLHERNITQVWKAYQYRLVDQLFTFGPTVTILMGDQLPASAQTGHERLKRLKGQSRTTNWVPGTIRGDLRSVNSLLSLMHSSDSAEESLSECAVFAGTPHLANDDPHDLRATLALLERSAPRETRGYRDVLAGLRAKVIASAWDELPGTLRKSARAMVETGTSELAEPGSGERLAGLLDADHPLADLLGADFTPASPGPDPARVQLVLATYGTGLDKWEQLVLASSRRFPPYELSAAG
jgi:nucleoside diphosphate kinase